MYTLDILIYTQSGTDPSLLEARFRKHGDIDNVALPVADITVVNDIDEFYFKNIEDGWFNFHYESIPNGYRGFVEIWLDGVFLSAGSINPQELEASVDSSGANAVEITTEDADTSDPIPDVLVTIKTALGAFVDQKRTDEDGIAVFSLDDGDYTVSTNPLSGYSSVSNQAFTVDGAEAVTVELIPIVFPAPPIPGLSVVHTVFQKNGSPVEGATIEANLMGINHAVDGALQSNSIESDVSGADGALTLLLIQKSQFVIGGRYDIAIKNPDGTVAFRKTVEIPDTSPIELEDL